MHINIQHNVNITLFVSLKPTIKSFTNQRCSSKLVAQARELHLNFNSKLKMNMRPQKGQQQLYCMYRF